MDPTSTRQSHSEWRRPCFYLLNHLSCHPDSAHYLVYLRTLLTWPRLVAQFPRLGGPTRNAVCHARSHGKLACPEDGHSANYNGPIHRCLYRTLELHTCIIHYLKLDVMCSSVIGYPQGRKEQGMPSPIVRKRQLLWFKARTRALTCCMSGPP